MLSTSTEVTSPSYVDRPTSTNGVPSDEIWRSIVGSVSEAAMTSPSRCAPRTMRGKTVGCARCGKRQQQEVIALLARRGDALNQQREVWVGEDGAHLLGHDEAD